MQHLLWFLLIGLLAGWLAGMFWKGSGFGIIGDLIVGVIGALLGGWIFSLLGIALPIDSTIAELIVAILGALLFLFLIRLVRGGGR